MGIIIAIYYYIKKGDWYMIYQDKLKEVIQYFKNKKKWGLVFLFDEDDQMSVLNAWKAYLITNREEKPPAIISTYYTIGRFFNNIKGSGNQSFDVRVLPEYTEKNDKEFNILDKEELDARSALTFLNKYTTLPTFDSMLLKSSDVYQWVETSLIVTIDNLHSLPKERIYLLFYTISNIANLYDILLPSWDKIEEPYSTLLDIVNRVGYNHNNPDIINEDEDTMKHLGEYYSNISNVLSTTIEELEHYKKQFIELYKNHQYLDIFIKAFDNKEISHPSTQDIVVTDTFIDKDTRSSCMQYIKDRKRTATIINGNIAYLFSDQSPVYNITPIYDSNMNSYYFCKMQNSISDKYVYFIEKYDYDTSELILDRIDNNECIYIRIDKHFIYEMIV